MRKKRKTFFIRSFKIKNIIFLAIGCLFVFAICMYSSKTEFVSVPKNVPKIVIDAGHGGVDGGSVGRYTKVVESELNLVYAKNLKAQLEEYGFEVVLTREDSGGLYDENATNLKKSDMKKRKQIIEDSKCDIVVSIHMNSYVLESSHGAQVFYKKGNKAGEALAESVQGQVKSLIGNTSKDASAGDYYIVECTDYPAVLVECGFISNKKEELLLQQKSYQDKFCYSILCGIVSYFGAIY